MLRRPQSMRERRKLTSEDSVLQVWFDATLESLRL